MEMSSSLMFGFATIGRYSFGFFDDYNKYYDSSSKELEQLV